MIDLLLQIDTALFLFFNAVLHNPLFDAVFPVITKDKNWLIPGIAIISLYLGFKRKRALIGIGLALVTVAIADPLAVRILKPLVGRLRPCNPQHFVEGGRFLIGMKSSYSFPSAHALNLFAQAMLFSRLHPGATPWLFAVAGIISYTRIYVGVHYPFDVLAGAVFGMGVGLGVFLGYTALAKRIARAREPVSIENDSP
jgi:undecaprenyl-diphosphatase